MVAGGVIAVVAAGAVLGTQAAHADKSPSPFPSDLSDLRAQFAALGEQQLAYLASRPSTFLLPPDQAARWRQNWDEMRTCTLDHGFAGVPEVLPTYGDGATPSPVVDASQPGAAEAIAACPFVPNGMDLDALEAAATADAAQ